MDTNLQAVERHYGSGKVLDNILTAMKNSGKDLNRLTLDDLAPVDEFHIRGHEGTVELASRAPLPRGTRVLDVGCGIGGSSRYLAVKYGCRVTGIDLTHEFVEVAGRLSHMVGLDHSLNFKQGSALDLPFADRSFDVAWTQHVQMNIADKQKFYSEMVRVLSPGGRIIFHDIFRGPDGDPYYPVPWADDQSISALVAPGEVHEILEDLDMEEQVWEDTTQKSLAWMENMAAKAAAHSGPPSPGLHVLMGESTKVKFANVIRSLQENRLTVIQGVWKN